MRVRKVTYNDAQHTSQNAIARALMTKPEKISRGLVHLGGKERDAYPLSFMTEGMGNATEQEVSKSNEIEWDVDVRRRKTRPLIKALGTTAGSTGKGFQTFKLVFPDKWFVRQYTLSVGGRNTQVRVMDEPVPGEGGYIYTVKIVGRDASEYIPDKYLEPGTMYGQMFANVEQSFSKGNASNWQAPATVRHKLSTTRKSYHCDGNSNNYVADFEFKLKNGQTTNLWMSYEEYQHYGSWMEEYEMQSWHGKQNYTEGGTTTMVGQSGEPIVTGPGLLEQIQNTDTRSILTEDKLKTTVGDVFFGMTDGYDREVTLFTGTGGMRDFDQAMKEYLNDNTYAQHNDRFFVNDSGEKVELGKYFKRYQHVDGHTINVVKVPLFDHGAKAQASPKHPKTGFPIESHRMVFVDQTSYGGENNLQMVYRRGRKMKRWAVAGSNTPEGFKGQDSYLRATDVDGHSVHFLKEGLICLKRFDTSIDLRADGVL